MICSSTISHALCDTDEAYTIFKGEEFDCTNRLVIRNSEKKMVHNQSYYVADYMSWNAEGILGIISQTRVPSLRL